MHQGEISALFGKAVDHHLRGRFADALAGYDAVLRLDPRMAAAHCNRGLVLQSLQKYGEALQSYDRAIRLNPGYADAWYNRGLAFKKLNRLGDAEHSYDQAIRLKPDHAEAYANRGNVLTALGRPDEALRSLDKAAALRPDFADAWFNRGVALEALNRLDEAVASYDRAIAIRHDFADVYFHRGNAQQKLRRLNDAVGSYDQAIALKPDFAECYCNRSNALRLLERPEDALQSCDRAIALRPDFAETHNNKGVVLQELERPDEALQSFARAIELNPGFADAWWNTSTSQLLLGQFEEGFRHHEWRKRKSQPLGNRSFPQPLWLGREDISDKTLLIHSEQGLGDTIQFCRYAILARTKAAQVIFAAPEALMRLLGDLHPSVRIVGLKSALPAFDHHVPLLSMPLALGTTLDTCPADIPYLRAERDRVEKWRERLGSQGFRIGICWQGNRKGEVDIGRSFPLQCFERIAAIPNVRLISLQKNSGIEQLADLPAGMQVETLGSEFDSGPDAFVDSAAIMESLDLVITSDTAMAHLAGALGRPAWVTLKRVPDWRWLLDRSDSPWYPTLRLFRQTRRGDWRDVFDAMHAQLHEQITIATG